MAFHLPNQKTRRWGRSDAQLPQPYMKQIKLHPSGCQQWSSQVVAGGGHYFAYASTLMTYVYDARDFSLVTILGGSHCNVHSILWHPQNPHRVLVFSTDGHGSEWHVQSEEQIMEYNVGAPPVCTAWDPSDQSNLAVISKGSNATYILRKDEPGQGKFRKCFVRRSSEEEATCAKWSQYEPGVLVIGWTDGRVSFAATAGSDGKGKSKLVSPSEENGAVVDLRHDPHGGAYVLIAYSSGSVILWDAACHSAVATFDRCAVGLTGVRWMAWAAGSFLALSSKTGVAKVFNISQKNSIETIRLGETGCGIRDMAWLPAQSSVEDSSMHAVSRGPKAICGFQDGSLSVADTAFGKQGYETGSRSNSGGGSGAVRWASKAGHIETVFSCAHRPGDPDTLATGSYGSSVKVWHVPTMDLKVTLTGQTGPIYSVAWSTDGERIASTSGKGTVWIWDAESGKAQRRLQLHSLATHSVQWDPSNTTRLASAGADRSLVIFSDKGTVENTYVHPGALFGCNWCPSYANIIATGCQDGNIRVFDISWKGGSGPQYVLSGHKQRVFHVNWSPLLDATLASGSDDCNIMIWRLGKGALPRSNPAGSRHLVSPSAVLKGHTSNVRPLHWNSEVPWLLLSGSWDGTVRAWDIRRAGMGQNHVPLVSDATSGGIGSSRACVAVMSDHVADVYSISTAPGRPFLYASVSRDTTLRQFTLEGIVSTIKIRAIMEKTLTWALRDTKQAMLLNSPAVLCGKASRSLETQLCAHKRKVGISLIESYRILFDFFWGSDGIDTFWETLRWVRAAATRVSKPGVARDTPDCLTHRSNNGALETIRGGTEAVDIDYNLTTSLKGVPQGLMVVDERVIHRDARRASDRALARLLVSCPTFIVQDRQVSRSDRVQRASRLHLATGDLRSSCEALVTLEKWERALALAPGVGIDYWRELAGRYIDELRAGRGGGGSGDTGGGGRQSSADVTALASALLVSSGRPLEAIDVLKNSDEALTLAASVTDGVYPPSEQCSVAAAYTCGNSSGRRTELEEGSSRRTAVNSRPTTRKSEAKLLALLDDHLTGTTYQGRVRATDLKNDNELAKNRGEEGKASPKNDANSEGREEWCEYHLTENEFKGAVPSPELPSLHNRMNLLDKQSVWATQRNRGEAILRSITESRAQVFFQASQPTLAAAAMLSVCDGTRAMAAPAISLLLRGEEPELAYAAAKALQFPARELCPLVREMARRAEAWGDLSLSVELLLEAGGEDVVSGRHGGSRSEMADGVSDEDDNLTACYGGYWPADAYGIGGEKAGPLGAALVALRGNAAKDSPCPKVKFRSKASYLEDAAAAESRGSGVEAVQLLVLAGELEKAADCGISFLLKILSANPLPPRSLKSAMAITRAFGSGSGPSLLANQLDPVILNVILAYSSYVGALEAKARGYHSVIAPLLRNASVCAEAVDIISGQGGQQDSAYADGKNSSDAGGTPLANLHDVKQNGECPRSTHNFPPCMAVRGLAFAAFEHVKMESIKKGARGTRSENEPHCVRQVGLGLNRKVRDQDNFSTVEGAKADGELDFSADYPTVKIASQVEASAPAVPANSTCSTVDSETKSRGDDDEYNEEPGAGFFYTKTNADETIEGTGVPFGGNCRSSTWHGAIGEIIVSGSRLPSCRRHKRVVRGALDRTPESSEKISSVDCSTLASTASKLAPQAWPLTAGAVFLLEDGETAMGLSDAVMWAKVNPFSPLNTGSRIMPF